MSEAKMEAAVQEALAREGIGDEVLAAGPFNPRGHSGALFVGGVAGQGLGGVAGAAGAAAGTVGGIAGGVATNDAVSGLPPSMLVGVTESDVYGSSGGAGGRTPGALGFKVPREGLKAEVHQRVDVRVLELIDESSGSQVELEGNRLPMTHSKDVIEELTAS